MISQKSIVIWIRFSCNFIGGAENVIDMPFQQADKDDRWKLIRDTKISGQL
jgi:hypothetical protein